MKYNGPIWVTLSTILKRPKAITFSMVSKEEPLTAVQASLSELSRLLDTLGYDVEEELIQHKMFLLLEL